MKLVGKGQGSHQPSSKQGTICIFTENNYFALLSVKYNSELSKSFHRIRITNSQVCDLHKTSTPAEAPYLTHTFNSTTDQHCNVKERFLVTNLTGSRFFCISVSIHSRLAPEKNRSTWLRPESLGLSESMD